MTANGAQIAPDPGTRVYEFTGSMILSGLLTALKAAIVGGPKRAEPVEPATGIYVMEKTDLYHRPGTRG